ncbi:MAG: glycosyltransferase family A protein [Kiritimatiellia bacterium]
MQLHIAMPAMDEMEWLPHTIESVAGQNLKDFKVWICVNQPDSWWKCEDKREICENNARLLEWLSSRNKPDCQVIDRSGKGKGWQDRKGGVGAARKLIMDIISANADPEDVIVSLDADTLLDTGYLAAVRQAFEDNPDAAGYTARYYHKLSGEEKIDRAILRYEIYMRHFLLNLMRIQSPYAFTALGSALATTVKTYRKVGGLTPKKSAEDFYFLMKLAKSGSLIYGDKSCVYPASRVSERVIFGTGQAVLNGYGIMRERYPVFETGLFDDIAETTEGFPQLYDADIELPMSSFLRERLNNDNLWEGLRQNHSSRERFVRACHERVDALRIFQYLRSKHDFFLSDERNLFQSLKTYFADEVEQMASPAVRDLLAENMNSWSIDSASIEELDELRNLLSAIEDSKRVRIKSARFPVV